MGGCGICTHIRGGEVALGWCGCHRRGETTTSHIHDCTQPSMSPCPQGSNIPLEGTHHSDIITCVYHTVYLIAHISAPSGPLCAISHNSLCVLPLQPWPSPWTVPANISTEIPNSITLTVFVFKSRMADLPCAWSWAVHHWHTNGARIYASCFSVLQTPHVLEC